MSAAVTCINESVANSREGIRFADAARRNRHGAETCPQTTIPTIFQLLSQSCSELHVVAFRFRLCLVFGFGLAFGHWIHTSRQRFAGSEVTVAGLAKREQAGIPPTPSSSPCHRSDSASAIVLHRMV